MATNILPLDTWRQILGFNPYHFWGQSGTAAGLAVTSKCNTVLKEYTWQKTDATGRETIREAIATAEARLFEYLGYRVGQQYVSKTFQYPRPYDPRMSYSGSSDARGRWLSVNVDEGYIQAVGVEAFTTINAAQAIVYTDEYGDSVEDTFTLTVDLTGLDPQPIASEIAVYFAAADRLDSEGRSQRWRIKPVSVTISGVTATVIGRSWLLVRPVKYQGISTTNIDPTDVTAGTNNFAQTLDVARRYTSTTGATTATSQAVLIWETDPPVWATPCGGTGLSFPNDNSGDPAAIAQAIARAGIRDAMLGEIAPAEVQQNATTAEFTAVNWGTCRQPDRVIIRYLAGANADELNSSIPYGGQWDAIVARLAMAELARPLCACEVANKELFRWQLDLAQTSGNNDISFQAVSPEQLNNPLGTRRGAVYAWNQIKNLALTRAFIV